MAGCAGVMAAGLVILLAVVVLGSASRLPTAAATTVGPTRTAPTPAPTTTSPTGPAAGAPTTDSRPRDTEYTRYHPPGAYANDGYDPGTRVSATWPTPSSMGQAIAARTSNAVYGSGVPQAVRCEHDPAQAGMVSDAALEQSYSQFVGCLMRVWKDAVGNAYDFPRPPVKVFHGQITTPCGKVGSLEVGGFYCTASGVLFISGDNTARRNEQGLLSFIAEFIVGHEFGHHIQARSGIMTASWMYQDSLSGAAAHVEASRRELQADCLSAMSLAVVATSMGLSGSDAAAILSDRTRGASSLPDHGNATTVALWINRGSASRSVATCNTFTAPASEVAS